MSYFKEAESEQVVLSRLADDIDPGSGRSWKVPSSICTALSKRSSRRWRSGCRPSIPHRDRPDL